MQICDLKQGDSVRKKDGTTDTVFAVTGNSALLASGAVLSIVYDDERLWEVTDEQRPFFAVTRTAVEIYETAGPNFIRGLTEFDMHVMNLDSANMINIGDRKLLLVCELDPESGNRRVACFDYQKLYDARRGTVHIVHAAIGDTVVYEGKPLFTVSAYVNGVKICRYKDN